MNARGLRCGTAAKPFAVNRNVAGGLFTKPHGGHDSQPTYFYLGAYALRRHDAAPLLLMASDDEGVAVQTELTNRRLSTPDGQAVPDRKLGLRRDLLVLEDGPVDTIALRNFCTEPVTLPLSLAFGSQDLRSKFSSYGPEGNANSIVCHRDCCTRSARSGMPPIRARSGLRTPQAPV